MNRMARTLLTFGILVGFLAGCNTIAGLGKDVEKVGTKIENKAEEKKSY